MNQKPTVAILLATFNGGDYLEQQLDSILSQTYQNFKIYISDDCSSDHTVEIISKYQQKYPTKFFYVVNKKNIGYVKNFESLLLAVTEQYIALSDQDDIWKENKLELQMRAILNLEQQHPDKACLVHSDLCMIDEDGAVINDSYFRYRSYKVKLCKDLGHILGPCGVMGNTILFNYRLKEIVLPFPDKLDVHDYWLAVNNELFGIRKTLPNTLVQYRIHNFNVSNSKNRLEKKRFKILNRNIKLPNIETNRKYFLPQLVEKIDNPIDKKILQKYIDYLNLNGNKFKIYGNLVWFSLIKRNVFYRIKVLIKIIFTNRW